MVLVAAPVMVVPWDIQEALQSGSSLWAQMAARCLKLPTTTSAEMLEVMAGLEAMVEWEALAVKEVKAA